MGLLRKPATATLNQLLDGAQPKPESSAPSTGRTSTSSGSEAGPAVRDGAEADAGGKAWPITTAPPQTCARFKNAYVWESARARGGFAKARAGRRVCGWAWSEIVSNGRAYNAYEDRETRGAGRGARDRPHERVARLVGKTVSS